MQSSEVRSQFIAYFKERGHTPVDSASLIPGSDPTLLFTNAGMVQFKGVFLGEENRPYVRAVSSQKCMRAGGKHNDLEQVGKTARHHTFFEMLGNFSFGDYFKKEAILYAWELVTEVFQLPQKQLWITVYQDDDDAETIWQRYLPKDRIRRLGKRDNFWQMGEIGPCGPCSEIMVDQGEAIHPGCPGPGACDCDRYLEIWNLVFMQYNQTASEMMPLPNPSIDTGMGLERMTAVCQGVLSNYETDLFHPIFSAIAKLTKQSLAETVVSVPARVIADHLRAMTFLIHDGVVPSNEGRGYVLRRIIRRAARFAKKLGLPPIGPDDASGGLHTLTGAVIDKMHIPYPTLLQHRDQIRQMVQREEERFEETLNRGGVFLEEIIASIQKKNETVIPGEAVFKLYDTYGFPMDITTDIAQEAGLSIDEPGFHRAMEEQRERARRFAFQIAASTGGTNPAFALLNEERPPTPFTGYEHLSEDVTVMAILKSGQWVNAVSSGEEADLLFDVTPFYSEGGGQVGDRGTLVSSDTLVVIEDTQRPASKICFHHAKVVDGTLTVGTRAHVEVDSEVRQSTARNHTATHLLHAVLRDVLGDHVKQAGSLVHPDRLRFDFNHFNALSPKEMDRIEADVNHRILQSVPVDTNVMEVKEAIASGAMALFGEKYGDAVRVVSVSDFSRELCGGTHCRNTGQIGLFKIVREGSVSSGVRRIEAVTGVVAYQWMKQQETYLREVSGLLRTAPEDVLEKTTRLLLQSKEKDQQIEKLKFGQMITACDPLLEVTKVGDVSLLVQKMPPSDMKALRLHADRLRNQLKSGIVVVGAGDEAGEKASLVVMVTPEWAGRFSASAIVQEMAKELGGTGGGTPTMAQAGGKDVQKLDAALKKSVEVVKAIG